MNEERPPDAGAASNTEATAAVGQSEAMSPATRRKATKAVLLYRRGLTMEHVAGRLGVSVARVCQYLRALNEPARSRGPAPGGAEVERRRAKVLELWPALGTTSTAERLGVSRSTITRDAEALGLPVQPGPRALHPRLEFQCPCSCGTTVRPDPAVAAAGNGRYVNKEHYRRHLEAARAEFAEQKVWMSITEAAKELKVHPQTVRQWGGVAGRGRVRLRLVRFEDVPRFAHLQVIGLQYVVRVSEVRALRKELLNEWRSGGGVPPDRLLDWYGTAARNRWTGRRPREFDGGEHGVKGGRDRDWGERTAEIQQRILDLDRQGLSTRDIAADPDVFGDAELHLRVWRYLNA